MGFFIVCLLNIGGLYNSIKPCKFCHIYHNKLDSIRPNQQYFSHFQREKKRLKLNSSCLQQKQYKRTVHSTKNISKPCLQPYKIRQVHNLSFKILNITRKHLNIFFNIFPRKNKHKIASDILCESSSYEGSISNVNSYFLGKKR